MIARNCSHDRDRTAGPRLWTGAVSLLAVFVQLAVSGQMAKAECRLEGTVASLEQANRFLTDPTILFHRGADGLPHVSFAVMQLATNAPAAELVVLKPIFAKANTKQRAAIGKGLYQAYYTCQQTNFTDAAAIRNVLATMGYPPMLAAFQRAKAESEEPVAAPAVVDERGVRRARDERLNTLMPGLRANGSLDLSDPAVLPGD